MGDEIKLPVLYAGTPQGYDQLRRTFELSRDQAKYITRESDIRGHRDTVLYLGFGKYYLGSPSHSVRQYADTHNIKVVTI